MATKRDVDLARKTAWAYVGYINSLSIPIIAQILKMSKHEVNRGIARYKKNEYEEIQELLTQINEKSFSALSTLNSNSPKKTKSKTHPIQKKKTLRQQFGNKEQRKVYRAAAKAVLDIGPRQKNTETGKGYTCRELEVLINKAGLNKKLEITLKAN
jgi:hypothetical protein